MKEQFRELGPWNSELLGLWTNKGVLYDNLAYVFVLDKAFIFLYFQTINANSFGRDDDDDDDDDYRTKTIIANIRDLLTLCRAPI